MNRKLVWLNLVLIALAVAMGSMLRARWLALQARHRAVLDQQAKAQAVFAPSAAAAPKPVAPADYFEVAQRTLFSKDRNPTVVIETPPPKPQPPMPPLPHYHGQMSLGEPVVFLSTDAAETQKSYHAGETVGPFQVVSFDREKITLNWDGRTVERKLAELAPKEAPAAPPPPARAAASRAPGAPGSSGVVVLGAGADASKESQKPALGADTGGGFRACVPGDNSPAGTLLEGYKKVVTATPFGQSCHWEQAK